MYKNIIGIFGVPRSGTSWLGQIFNSSPQTKYSYQPMFTDIFLDCIHPRSTADEIKTYMDRIFMSEDDFLSQDDGKQKGKPLSFSKKNIDTFVFKEVMFLYMIPVFLRHLKNMKIVFIIRNPVDVLTSWYNAPREFYPEWDIYEEWQFAQTKNAFLPERYYGYYKWKESVKLAYEILRQYPNQFVIVRYEDLDKNPIEKTKELFSFADIKYSEQTELFIKKSKSITENDPYSVFRSNSTRNIGKKSLPKTIVQAIRKDLPEFIATQNDWHILHQYLENENGNY